MKNYVVSETSKGRKIYSDDFLAIQDSAKALLHMFDVCSKNFVISGCGVTLNLFGSQFSVAEGYVYIDGDICYFPGYTGNRVVNQKYVIKKAAVNSEDIYGDGTKDVVFTEYKATFSGTETSTSILNSDKGSGAVAAVQVGNYPDYNFPTIGSVFLNEYCVVKSSSGGSSSTVEISNAFKAAKYLFGACSISQLSDGDVQIELPSQISGKKIQLKITKAGGLVIYNDGEIDESSVTAGTVNCDTMKAEDVVASSITGPSNASVSIPSITSSNVSSTKVQATNISTSKIVNPSGESSAVSIPNAKIGTLDLGSPIELSYGDVTLNNQEAFSIKFSKISKNVVAYSGLIVIHGGSTTNVTTTSSSGLFKELYDAMNANSEIKNALIPNNSLSGNVNAQKNLFITGISKFSSIGCVLSTYVNGTNAASDQGMIYANYTCLANSSANYISFVCQGLYIL